jgi:hypothetical protein
MISEKKTIKKSSISKLSNIVKRNISGYKSKLKLYSKKSLKSKSKSKSKSKKITQSKGCVFTERIINEKHFNSNYLKNKICKFIPLFDFNPNIKKNIVSACFFKMNKGGYKDFSRYYDGINFLYKVMTKEMPDFSLRVFIDTSIYNDKEIMSYLLQNENIELVLYCCESYARNEQFHLGTFGTMVRIFPLFDFENNDSNRVIISDIDVIPSETGFTYEIFDHYRLLIKNYTESEIDSLYIFNQSILVKDINFRYIENKYKYFFDNKYITPYVYFNYMIGIRKIPTDILENFLIKVPNSNKIYSTWSISPTEYDKRCEEFVCYGIDEYFSHKVLYPYLIKNKMAITYLIRFNIYRIFLLLFKELKKPEETEEYKKKIESYIFFITKNACNSSDIKRCKRLLVGYFNLLVNKEYLQKRLFNKKNPEHIIVKNLYQLFKKLVQEKDYSVFSEDLVKYLLSGTLFNKLRRSYFVHHNSNLKSKDIENIIKI